MDELGIAVIGAGAVGQALARRLAEGGYRLDAVLSRDGARARTLAAEVGAPIASAAAADVPAATQMVFCCVPDDAVGTVARALSRARADWSGVVIAHTSGALPASALYPLGEQGAALLSFHPLQTFTPEGRPEAFDGIYVTLEGDDGAVNLGTQVAAALGAQTLRLSAEAKTRYHLSAAMASNFFVTLMALVGEVLASIDVPRPEGAALMRPLVEGTLKNLAESLPEDVLTGPIARGDRRTVAAHLDALRRHLPHLLPVYAALSTEAVRVAVRGGHLAPEAAQALLDLVHTALDPYQEP